MLFNDKSKLFRKEAINFKDRSLSGRAVITSPTSFKLLTVLIILFIALFFYLTTSATYARQELVAGRLVPQGEFSKLVALKSGTLSVLAVTEGQFVEKGELLLEVESPYYDQQGENVHLSVASEYDDTLKLLDDSFVLEQSLSKQLQQKLKQDILVKQKEKAVTQSLINIQQQKVEIISEELADIKLLIDNQQLSKSEYKFKKKELLDEEIELQRLSLQQQNIESVLISLNYEASTIKEKLSVHAQKVNLDKADIKRSLLHHKTESGYQLRAPISGYVTALVVKPGQQVTQNEALLSITSKESMLEAEFFVPTKAIGFINETSKVRIRYVAFPYQKFGSYHGKVKSISKTILYPKEHEGRSGLNTPVYQVIVTLATQSIKYGDVEQSLQQGMEVQAYLMGEKRSLLEWLFEPLLAFDRKLWP